jgi:ZIP family zinc transporter
MDLLPTSISEIGSINATIAFFSGMIFIMIIDFFIPHEYIEEHIKNTGKDSKLMMAGIFTAIGITIHNFPEGLAVFISASDNIQMGFRVAFAVMIHNIPEGIAIAVPIYCATNCRSKAVKYALLSGIAEPAGALLGILLLGPFLNMFVLHFALAVVAGIMIFISFDELLPLSFEHEKNHVPMFGIIIGMLIMAFSIHFF